MRKQQGFGLIEVLVAMSLLSVATLAIVNWFGMQKSSDANFATAMKNLQDQRILERAIWAKYDHHNNAIDACDIRATRQISLAPDNATCISGTDGAVWAEAKQLSDTECTLTSVSSQILTFTDCSKSNPTPDTNFYATYAENINASANKSAFRVFIWYDNNAMTCTLAKTPTPAIAGNNNLQLTLSSDCEIGLTLGNPVAAQLPQFAIKLLGKGNRDDGYHRYYY